MDSQTSTPTPAPGLQCPARINAAAFSSCGEKLATAGNDGWLRVYRIPELELGWQYFPTENAMQAVAFSQDGSLLASAGQYCNGEVDLRIFDAESGDPRTAAETWVGMCPQIQFSPDGRFILGASGWGQRAIVLWDAATGRIVKRYEGWSAFPSCAIHTGKWVAAGEGLASRGPFKIQRLSAGSGDLIDFIEFDQDILQILHDRELNTLFAVTGLHESVIHQIDYMEGLSNAKRLCEVGRLANIHLRSAGKLLLVQEDGQILLLDSATQLKPKLVSQTGQRVMTSAYDPNCNVLALFSPGGQLRLIEPKSD